MSGTNIPKHKGKVKSIENFRTDLGGSRNKSSGKARDHELLFEKTSTHQAISLHKIQKSHDESIKRILSPRTTTSTANHLSSSSKQISFKHLSEKAGRLEKIAIMREELSKIQLKECTFSPRIIGERKVRSPEQYYKDQLRFEESRQQKVKEKQKELSQSTLTEINSLSHIPAIAEQSVKLASKHKYEEGTIERLHKGIAPKVKREESEETNKNDGKSNPDAEFQKNAGKSKTRTDTSPETVFTFTPVLNIRSKNLLRIVPVEDILYEDAKRRQKQQNEQKIMMSFESPLNPNSEKFLIERFYKEFLEICEWESLTYSDFQMTLQSMHFLLGQAKSQDKERDLSLKLWKLVSRGAEESPNERVLMTLLAVMRYQSAIFTDSEEAISPEETETLHQQYYLLYCNRLSVTNKSSINRSLSNKELESLFTPDICPNSRKIVESVSIEQINRRKLSKKMEIIKEMEEKSLEECTFQPKISHRIQSYKSEETLRAHSKEHADVVMGSSNKGEALYNCAQIDRERKENALKEERRKLEEKELKECTFNPNADGKGMKKTNLPEDTRKVTERLYKVNEEKFAKKCLTRKELILQGKFPPKKKGTVKNSEKLGKSSGKSKGDMEFEKEKKITEWEENKIKEIKRNKLENEVKMRHEQELDLEKKRKIEGAKKLKYDKIRQIAEEKKLKSFQKSNSKGRNSSMLFSSSSADRDQTASSSNLLNSSKMPGRGSYNGLRGKPLLQESGPPLEVDYSLMDCSEINAVRGEEAGSIYAT